jgi:hypothetical protein
MAQVWVRRTTEELEGFNVRGCGRIEPRVWRFRLWRHVALPMYFSSQNQVAQEVTNLALQKVYFVGAACVFLEVAPTQKWCRGRNC